MAVFRQSYTAYYGPDGRKCKKKDAMEVGLDGEPTLRHGFKRVKKKSRKYYGLFRDRNGDLRRKPLCKDKVAAQQMLAEIVRRVERGEAGLISPYAEHYGRPLSAHLEDYRKSLVAKGDTEQHVRTTHDRIKAVLDSCKFKSILDIAADRVEQQLAEWRREGKSVETSNHYLRACKAFTAWLVKNRRTDQDWLKHLSRINPEPDRRRIRRALTAKDFVRLIEAAKVNPRVICG